MMKRVAIALALAFAACVAFGVLAEDFDGDALLEYCYRQRLEGFVNWEDCVVRARYALRLRREGEAVDDVLAEAYGGYADIQLIEFGYCEVEPILQSSFVCAGIPADGEIKILPTPFQILERTYNLSVLDGLEIEKIE